MQEKLRELIAKWNKQAEVDEPNLQRRQLFSGCYKCARELKAVLAASEPAPQPEQIIEIDEDGKVHYPPCSCFTCPQHGPLLKAIEQREQIRLAKSNES